MIVWLAAQREGGTRECTSGFREVLISSAVSSELSCQACLTSNCRGGQVLAEG